MTQNPESFPGVQPVPVHKANRLLDTQTGDFLRINDYTETDYIIQTPSEETILKNERDHNRYVPVKIYTLME